MLINEARALLLAHRSGVLSTHSQAVRGYTFGSLVPYGLDAQGYPVILISHLAQHYQNILADNKVSLLVSEQNADVQNAKRLTWVANAQSLSSDEQDAIEHYYAAFPDSRDYTAMGFHFYRLIPVQIYYIGGLGKVAWYRAAEWVTE
jgi:hypothetical protein